jgi:hypothetical protein
MSRVEATLTKVRTNGMGTIVKKINLFSLLLILASCSSMTTSTTPEARFAGPARQPRFTCRSGSSHLVPCELKVQPGGGAAATATVQVYPAGVGWRVTNDCGFDIDYFIVIYRTVPHQNTEWSATGYQNATCVATFTRTVGKKKVRLQLPILSAE